MQTRSPLEDELRARISGEVRFDDGSRALYSTDGSVYRQVPIVVLEPSCASVFRDELPGLFPHDTDALRLSRQT